MKHSLAILFLLPALAWADPPSIQIDKEIAPNGQYVRMLPKTDAASVAYVGIDGLDPIPSDVLKDGRLFLLDTRGLAIGRYRFAAVAASKTGEQARVDFVVVIGTGPLPPNPPQPPNPPNPPTDPFTKSLQAAYDADAAPDKATSLAKLQAAFKKLAIDAGKRPDSTNAVFAVWAKSITEDPATGLPDLTKLKGVRSAIRDDVSAAWGGTMIAPLTAADAATELTKVSNALNGVR